MRHEDAQEMREGPSGPVYRNRSQTTLSCFPQRREVVSVKGKAWHRTMSGKVQGDERKRTTDEVSKTKGWRRNWRLTLIQDKSRRETVYCLDGVRHRSGVNLMQALVWNVGTCRSDGKGETQIGGPTRVRVPMRSTGADQLVVVLKSL